MRMSDDPTVVESWNTEILPGRLDDGPTIIATRDFRMQDEQVYWGALREPFISEVTDDWWLPVGEVVPCPICGRMCAHWQALQDQTPLAVAQRPL